MSLSTTLSNALSGLQVAQQALAVTAHNVANANTPGYSRKVLSQEAVVIVNRGAGVSVSEIKRITDEFLSAEVRRQASVTGRSETIAGYHDLLQSAFGAPGDGRDLASQLGELLAAFDALAVNPETAASAAEVIDAVEQLAGALGGLADHGQRLRGEADQEIGRTIAEINSEIQAIHDLNSEIQRLDRVGQDTAELLDPRDALVKSLAEKIDVRTYLQDNGTLAVYTAGGQTLIDNAPRTVTYEPASLVNGATVFAAIRVLRSDEIDAATGQPLNPSGGALLVSGGVRATLNAELQNDATADADQQITSRLEGGSLAGLLEVRDSILPAFDDQIQELADALRYSLNAAHNASSAVPPPATLAGTRTDLSAFAGATRSGTATFAVIDASDGSTVQAFQIDLAAVTDESDLAAQIDTALGALGSAALAADGNLEITLADAAQGLAIAEGDSAITVTDAAGRDRDYGLSHFLGLNDLVVGDGPRASDFAVCSEIASDPGRLATARLDVTAGPPLTATLGGAGDNRGAQALADALSTAQPMLARGGLPAKSATLAAYAGDIIARSAVLAASAGQSADRERAMTDELEFRAAAVSGVNLDEEMARMIQLQQAYSTAARLVAASEALFDELLGTVS